MGIHPLHSVESPEHGGSLSGLEAVRTLNDRTKVHLRQHVYWCVTTNFDSALDSPLARRCCRRELFIRVPDDRGDKGGDARGDARVQEGLG